MAASAISDETFAAPEPALLAEQSPSPRQRAGMSHDTPPAAGT